MIGLGHLSGDERLMQPPLTLDPAFVEEVSTAYLGWSMARTKREALVEAQSHGLLSGVINTPGDVLTDPVFRGRGVWEEIEHPVAGTSSTPAGRSSWARRRASTRAGRRCSASTPLRC